MLPIYNLHDCILTWAFLLQCFFFPISQGIIYQTFGFFQRNFVTVDIFDHCLPHRIQQPIPKPTCSRSFNQASSNWSNNLWKFRFVVSELVIGSSDQDNSTYVTLYAYKSELAWLHTWGSFNNYVDEMRWVGSPKMSNLVHVQGKTVRIAVLR